MSVKKNENRLFWIVTAIALLAGITIVSCVYQFNDKVSRLEQNYSHLKEESERADLLTKERIGVLEKLLETKLQNLSKSSSNSYRLKKVKNKELDEEDATAYYVEDF